MTPSEVLAKARAAGVEVLLKRDLSIGLRYPHGALTEQLRDELIATKACLVRILLIEEGRCQGCGTKAWRLAVVDEDGAMTCGPCSTGATALARAGVPLGQAQGRSVPVSPRSSQ